MLPALLGGSVILTLFALYMTYVRIRTILRSLDAIDRRQLMPPMAPWLPWVSIVSMIAAPSVSVLAAFIVFVGIEKSQLDIGGWEFIVSVICLLASAFNLLINFSIYDRSRSTPNYGD